MAAGSAVDFVRGSDGAGPRLCVEGRAGQCGVCGSLRGGEGPGRGRGTEARGGALRAGVKCGGVGWDEVRRGEAGAG